MLMATRTDAEWTIEGADSRDGQNRCLLTHVIGTLAREDPFYMSVTYKLMEQGNGTRKRSVYFSFSYKRAGKNR